MSPGVLPRQPADIKQETPSRKTPSKSKMSDGVDLRTIWKTKKTPSKSPIMKEVLVKEEEGISSDVSTPKNHKEGLPGAVAISIKKKKTLTWADALESCQTTTQVSETKDEQCASLQIKPETFHYAMQDSPNQEKTTSSPDKNTHVTTLTNSLNSLNNMQLPVCLTGSSSTHSASPSGGIDNENQPDITDCCSNADHTLVSHQTTSFAQLESDSLLVSQQEVGQHKSNVLANKTQDEFLQKQIELFNEKKRQLAKLQMQIQEQLYKASDVEPVSSHHDAFSVGLVQSTAEEQSANRNENRQKDCNTLTEQVDNQHFSRNLNVLNQDFTYKSDTLTQGINVSRQVNLDLNSNVTVSDDTFENLHNVNVKENLSAPSLHPPDHFSGTQNEIEVFCTPTQQRVRLEEEENITPYILKPKSNLKEVTETGEGWNQLDVGSQLLNLSDENEKIGVPLWTPLAMKTVAKQQAVGDNFDIFSIENTKRDIKSETDIIAKSEIDISVINSEHSGDRVNGLVPNTSIIESSTKSGVCGEQCPKTPPNKRSAFRSLSSSGLTPVVGSLSLRGNTDVKFETCRMHQSDSLHNCVLRAANERYLEALLDDEVSLFMCRLSPGNGLKKGRDFCHDPVARILLGGDDMHFIPIEMDSSDLNSVHIDGSAFTKFATRAT
ncbi:uncharacterized protein LOC132741043 [Ruditapes philippinarum]|uniref:uncharacterized protein LOC132741043 n=1 Tax=Ruditapes philippinarum TaxID=129788 RepID=UPI00295B69E3|nr:uncharacterized protein LOC132741043 [Ruditapes philippinarum]